MIPDTNKIIGYWLFESSSPGGSWFPQSSFVVFEESGSFWSGCLKYDYSKGSFEVDDNIIIASDPSYGSLIEFKYFSSKDQIHQFLTSDETGRGSAVITFKRISLIAFEKIAIKHLCRIKGVNKNIAEILIKSAVLFILQIANWSDKDIIIKSSEINISIEVLKELRIAAKSVG